MTNELDRLERRAQEVRGRLALDLDELFLRLQPRRMARSIDAYARDTRAGGDLGRDIVRDMRHNPVPYLLVAIGIAGFVWTISSFSRARTRARLPEFSDADFAPPPSPRAAAATVKAASARSTTATPPVSPAAAVPAREISPANSGER